MPSDRFPRRGLPAFPAEIREPLELEFRFASGTAVWPVNDISERGVFEVLEQLMLGNP